MNETSVYDVAILGAGPGAMAAASARVYYSAKQRFAAKHEGRARRKRP